MKIEGWDDVIMHLVRAQKAAEGLPRDGCWGSYIDEMHCDDALAEMIESAKDELSRNPLPPAAPEPAQVHPFTD